MGLAILFGVFFLGLIVGAPIAFAVLILASLVRSADALKVTIGGHDKECTAARVWFETGCWHDGTPILSNEHYATRPLFHQKTKLLAIDTVK